MTEEGSGPERRRHERHEVYAQVHVKRGRIDLVMEVHDISEGGAFIELGSLNRPKWLELGQELQLGIFLPDSDTQIELTGVIVRIVEALDARGFAVQFEDTDDNREAVLALISDAAPTPPPLPGASSE